MEDQVVSGSGLQGHHRPWATGPVAVPNVSPARLVQVHSGPKAPTNTPTQAVAGRGRGVGSNRS